jgi:hypothetical protein
VSVLLDGMERRFLRSALLDWGGPARPTDELAVAMGFTSADRLSGEARALWERIEAGEALTTSDWRQVLLAVEIVFASDVVGSGLDWRITSGISDEESLALLRGLQRKLPRWRSSVQFTVNETGGVDISDPDRPQLLRPLMPRSALSTVAHHLADECCASPDGGQKLPGRVYPDVSTRTLL